MVNTNQTINSVEINTHHLLGKKVRRSLVYITRLSAVGRKVLSFIDSG